MKELLLCEVGQKQQKISRGNLAFWLPFLKGKQSKLPVNKHLHLCLIPNCDGIKITFKPQFPSNSRSESLLKQKHYFWRNFVSLFHSIFPDDNSLSTGFSLQTERNTCFNTLAIYNLFWCEVFHSWRICKMKVFYLQIKSFQPYQIEFAINLIYKKVILHVWCM